MTEPTKEELQTYSDVFDELCQQRHNAGITEYGEMGFLHRDTLEMAMEEIADLANYARFTFIKLAMLQADLKRIADQDPGIGPSSFTPDGGE